MFIKYCGFTRKKDIIFAAACNIQAVGFIFYSKSKRYITPQKAAELGECIQDPKIKKIGIFVGSSISEIKETVHTARLDMVQIYESDLFEEVHNFIPVIRAYRIKDKHDIETIPDCPEGDLILLDSFHPTAAGGTGHVFNWNYLKKFPYLSKTLIAGGINIKNIELLLEELSPFGIDLSSGIEDAPGKKSGEKMRVLAEKIKLYNK